MTRNAPFLRRHQGLSLTVFTLVVTAAFSGWAYARWRATQVLFDDAFISYRYADNLVHGHGLVYNAGERVEGYTNFLWVLLAALVIRCGGDPISGMRTLGVACYVACVVACTDVALSGAQRFTVRRLPAVALVALLILPTGFASFAGTGLETPFVSLLILSMGLVGLLATPSRVSLAVSAALPLLALLTRMDTALAVVSHVLVTLAFHEEHRILKSFRQEWLIRCGPAAIGLTGYLGWKYAYYGDLLPNTYYAKAADAARFDVGAEYIQDFVQSCPTSLPLVVLCVVGLVVSRDRRRVAFIVYALSALALHLFYVAKVGGDFMEYRLLWEYWPLLVSAAVVSAVELGAVSLAAATAVAASVLPFAGRAVTVLAARNYMQSLAEMDGYASLAKEIGPVLERTLPAGTIVATTLAGSAYFMPSITTIDQWGLNDRFVGHLPVDRIEGRGHVKFAPESYLHDRGVNLYIEHPRICDCSEPCREGKPDVFVRLDENRCLRTWYFTPTLPLNDWFCSHPESFVLDNVGCPNR